MKDHAETLQDFVPVLESFGLPYAIMGGFAVRVYGIPRSTQDIDIVLLSDDEGLLSVLRLIEDRGYTVDEAYKRGGKGMVAGLHFVQCKREVGSHTVDVDLFLCESSFQHSLLNRRRREFVDGCEYWLISPEDLILTKICASRYRDYSDAEEVLVIQRQLDEDYMRHWAKQLGVLEKLDQVLNESREV
jgi:hypothetical protein